MRKSSFSSRLAAGVAVAAIAGAAAPAGVVVQSAVAQEAGTEIIVVTGVRGAPRSVLESPVPVDVIGGSELSSTGAVGGELGVALQSLAPSFNFQRQSNSGPADIVRPAQLRGMSPDQVLVLVNGKRRHTTSITTIDSKVGRGTAPVDFNSIPTNAIARIEVLRDGAGAQYGSDAIAGVINVILDERPEGVEGSLTYGGFVTDFEPTDEEITDGETWTGAGSFGLALGQDGFLRAGVEYTDHDDTNRAGFDEVPFFEDPANIPLVGGQRNFKPGDGAYENLNLWVNAGIVVTDAVDAYAFAIFNDRDGTGSGFFRYPVSSQNIQSVYPLGYRPVTTGDNEDISVTGGLKGTFWGDATWDGSVNYGRNEYTVGVRSSLNPSLGPTSPTSFTGAGTEAGLTSVNVDVVKPLELADLEGTLSFGGEYRNEFFESIAGDPLSYAAGPFADAPDFLAIGAQASAGLRPEETRDLDRDVFGVYGEYAVDITDKLFVDVAVRYEDYEDFGDTVAGKLAARYEITDAFAFRGAVSNSFRAPSLVQLGYGTSSTSFGAGGQLTTVNTLPVDDPVAVALGAEPLDAETAKNYSIGFTGSLFDGLTFTVDAFRIDVDDRITLSERIDCAPPLGAAALCASRNITAANFFTNAVDTRTEGVDIVVAYDLPLYGGNLALSAALSTAETEIRHVNDPAVPGVVVFGVEERNTVTGAAPEDRVIFTGDWSNDRFSLLGRVTRHGETTRVFNFGGGFEPEQTYGAEWQVDVEGGFSVNDNVELFAGAVNLLDEYPDRSSADIGYFGNLPYDVLSPIGMNGRYVYGGVRVGF
jgi:iron complex outermembrane receptor protein